MTTPPTPHPLIAAVRPVVDAVGATLNAGADKTSRPIGAELIIGQHIHPDPVTAHGADTVIIGANAVVIHADIEHALRSLAVTIGDHVAQRHVDTVLAHGIIVIKRSEQ